MAKCEDRTHRHAEHTPRKRILRTRGQATRRMGPKSCTVSQRCRPDSLGSPTWLQIDHQHRRRRRRHRVSSIEVRRGRRNPHASMPRWNSNPTSWSIVSDGSTKTVVRSLISAGNVATARVASVRIDSVVSVASRQSFDKKSAFHNKASLVTPHRFGQTSRDTVRAADLHQNPDIRWSFSDPRTSVSARTRLIIRRMSQELR